MSRAPKAAAFVAALGVDDLLLTGLLGLRPVGVVLGHSLHAADRVEPAALTAAQQATDDAGQPGEDVVRTTALESAWALGLARLLAQAEDLGADGVLGVELTVATVERGTRVAVTAHGTAVRTADDFDGSWRTDSTAPFTTTLSGRDVWLLAKTGYRPLGIVLGASTGPAEDPGDLTADGEHGAATQALYDARDRALARVRAEAAALDADGVVALRFDGVPPPPGAQDVRVVAWGTAVRRLPDHTPPGEPDIVLPLLGGRP
ncbi:MAG: heavy metal-binding domain-containing protein [Actinobacteria bacterium]|nr:heavy metal-binding domain-containing protein [Actinomycetota bacterium]